jgi:hypothetical protein
VLPVQQLVALSPDTPALSSVEQVVPQQERQ